ncbi:MAG TPA: hypothetical protein VHY32_12400 [Caulobacteraceae bacterium]|jgi:hypothetical protein|nr:hypothetical protein [Caulobacteraceae bacterium]
MSAVRYPIAANAEAALSAPVGRAARRTDACLIAGADIGFATEAVGPGFATREEALKAYAGRLDDERAESPASIAPEDRYCELRELSAGRPPRPGGSQPMRPVYRNGRRWPASLTPPRTIWRLSISYWRILPAAAESAFGPPSSAEPAGRKPAKTAMDAEALKARLSDPLRPVAPQQPLDIGLFEVRPPEAPHILMPDE